MVVQVFTNIFKVFLKRTDKMLISHFNIIERVINILKIRFDVKEDLLLPENYYLPLTGDLFRFTVVDLVYLLFEIEAEFKIRISPELLRNYGFSSIYTIASAIQSEII